MLNPYNVFSESLKFWTAATRAAQENWIQLATGQSTSGENISNMFPFPSLALPLDEAKIREPFQAAADMNLKAWTQMAEKIAAMPSWMRWPAEVPGRTMTDMFDMLRPFPVFYSAPDTAPSRPPMPKQTLAPHSDDLTEIKGIGPKIAEKLEALGIISFAQIANWTESDVLKIDLRLSLGGRIGRQDWVQQASRLAKPLLH